MKLQDLLDCNPDISDRLWYFSMERCDLGDVPGWILVQAPAWYATMTALWIATRCVVLRGYMSRTRIDTAINIL